MIGLRRSRASFTGVLALFATGSFASECPDQSQPGLEQCAAADYAKADEALNRAFKKVQQRLKDDGAADALFIKAQKAWLVFRDAECGFDASAATGGSIYPMIHLLCLGKITAERAKRLQDYLRCEEGDLSCPLPPKQ